MWAPGGRGVTDRLRGQRLCKEEREGRGRRRAPWRGMVSLAAGHPARPDGTRDTLGTPGKRHSTPCDRKAWVPSPAPPPPGTTPRASRRKETPAASAEVRRAQCCQPSFGGLTETIPRPAQAGRTPYRIGSEDRVDAKVSGVFSLTLNLRKS